MSDREVYVISDLHVGGRYPTSDDPTDRGFRMCTRVDALSSFVVDLAKRCAVGASIELVINGDFVDFLAEEGEDGKFVPFVADPVKALACFNRIALRDRDAPLFDALRSLSRAGGRLTILLGNHDLELSFPAVRARFLSRIGADEPSRITFLHDGEAYVVGDALIEHGNRYDGFNVVDHDALRRVRSLQSRGQEVTPQYAFEPPAGSRLVASIMNPVKQSYPFVDLLKPETEAVIPILLALEPGFRSRAIALLKLQREANRHAPITPAEPAYGGDISSTTETQSDYGGDLAGSAGAGEDGLSRALSATMGADAASRFATAIPTLQTEGVDIASTGAGTAWALLRLVTGGGPDDLDKRLPALLDALRVVQHDRSFDIHHETVPAYEAAARALADRGFRHVIFGHTHLAKQVDLGNGKTYFNTGTWADLIRFPEGILKPGNPDALTELRAFVDDLVHRRFAKYIRFNPTYVRLELDGERVTRAELITFEWPARK